MHPANTQYMHTIMIFFLFLLLLLVIGVKLLVNKTRRNRQNLPPGTTGWPFIGETLDFIRANLGGDQSKFIQDRVDRHGTRVFRTSLLGEPSMVVMCGPAANKFLFSNEGKKVALWWPPSVLRLMGPSLVTKVGNEGKVCKKLMMSFFGAESMSKFIDTMDDVTRRHFDTHWQGKEEITVYTTMKSFSFELACRFFMNVTEPSLLSRLEFHFNIFLKGVIALPLNFRGTRFYEALKAAESIRAELRTLIKQRREELQKKRNGGGAAMEDLLSYLILNPDENGRFLPEEEITNNMLLLLYAGHDTSSSALTFLIKCLADLPHVHRKLLQEQKEIAETKKAGELLRREDLQKMKYTWNVVSEVLRMTPPINGSYREAIEDFTFDGYTIPKGWKIYWTGSYTHKNSHERPEEFDETRYEGSGPAPFSYVPFGGGLRMCLGKEFARLEILIFVHNLVNRFDWDLVNPNEKLVIDPVPMPVQGLPIRLRSIS